MKKALLVAAAISVAGFAAWRWHGHTTTSSDSEKLLTNRIWVDHLPKNQRDTIQIFALLEDEAIGIFDARSNWRGQHEIFRFENANGELRVLYPQTGDKEKITTRARRCEGNKDWEYCLELDGGKGAKKYYSREGWEIESTGAAEALEQQLVHSAD